jgi:hypothetical protein
MDAADVDAADAEDGWLDIGCPVREMATALAVAGLAYIAGLVLFFAAASAAAWVGALLGLAPPPQALMPGIASASVLAGLASSIGYTMRRDRDPVHIAASALWATYFSALPCGPRCLLLVPAAAAALVAAAYLCCRRFPTCRYLI